MKYIKMLDDNPNFYIKPATKHTVSMDGYYQGVEFFIKYHTDMRAGFYSFETRHHTITVSKSDSYTFKLDSDEDKILLIKQIIKYNDLVKHMPQFDAWRKYMSDQQETELYYFGDQVNHALSSGTPSLLPPKEKAAEIMNYIKAAKTMKGLEKL